MDISGYAAIGGWAVGILAAPIFIIYVASTFLTPSFNYKGKHVLVTGGSSGIGLEAAREYLKRGAKVTIMARNSKKLHEAKDDLQRSVPGSTVVCVAVDASAGQATVDKALEPALRELGDVSVVVNSAGISHAGVFDEAGATDEGKNIFERLLHVNVLGSVYPTRSVLPGMKKQMDNGGGRIVFVSSQVAQVRLS